MCVPAILAAGTRLKPFLLHSRWPSFFARDWKDSAARRLATMSNTYTPTSHTHS